MSDVNVTKAIELLERAQRVYLYRGVPALAERAAEKRRLIKQALSALRQTDVEVQPEQPCGTCGRSASCIHNGKRNSPFAEDCIANEYKSYKPCKPDDDMEFVREVKEHLLTEKKRIQGCIDREIVAHRKFSVALGDEYSGHCKLTVKYFEDEMQWINKYLDALAHITRLVGEKKDILSGHFCPSPQLGKLADSCDCVHSDKHRAIDRATIDRLQATITTQAEDLAQCRKAIRIYKEQMASIIKDKDATIELAKQALKEK